MNTVIERNNMINSINDINQYKRLNTTSKASESKDESAAPAIEHDEVNLSQTSHKLSALQEIISLTAELNHARINYLKEQISQGSYEIFSRNIADRMLSEMQMA